MNYSATHRFKYLHTGISIFPVIDLWANYRSGAVIRWISLEFTVRWLKYELWTSLEIDF